MNFRHLHTAAGANKTSASADTRADGLVAYAAGSVVCLWPSRVRPVSALKIQPMQRQDLLHRGVQDTLLGHRASITAVRFLHTNPDFLLTGDSNGVLKLWHERQGVSLSSGIHED
jgi:WD40 repeat protein